MEYSDQISTLASLGLTQNEARVYLMLSQTEQKTVKDIAKITGIAREDIYRIMPSLQQKGLTEKSISSPTQYKALPIKQGMKILLKKQDKNYRKIKKRARELLQNLANNLKETSLENKNDFVLVPQKTALFKRIKNSIQNSRTSVNIVTSKKRYYPGVFEFLRERQKAIKRGAKFRILTDRMKEENVLKNYSSDEATNLEVRCLLRPPEAIIVIVDQKEVYVMTSADAALADAPALWSNNGSLLALAQSYFNNLWEKAKKVQIPSVNS